MYMKHIHFLQHKSSTFDSSPTPLFEPSYYWGCEGAPPSLLFYRLGCKGNYIISGLHERG